MGITSGDSTKEISPRRTPTEKNVHGLQETKQTTTQGTKNVLADTLSRLIEFDDSIKLPEEEPGYKFGYTPFEELPPASVTVIEEVIISKNQGDQSLRSLKIQHNDPIAKDIEIELP